MFAIIISNLRVSYTEGPIIVVSSDSASRSRHGPETFLGEELTDHLHHK